MTADWLINYNYGYLSRGLFGSLFINFFDNKEPMLDFLSFVLIIFYLLIFYFLSETFNEKKQNIISIILIFSPATFLFNIYDSQGSFRKEILGILALVILSSNIIKKNNIKIYASGAIYTIAIFSHSVNLFILSTLIFVLFVKIGSRKLRHYILFVGSTIVNLFSYLILSNSEQELYRKKDLICKDLDSLGLNNLCGYGTFDFITWDLNAAFLITQNYVINENRNASYIYILLFFISLMPLLFDRVVFKEVKYYFFVGLSFVPLFLLAFDWGRWIYLISICFLIIYLTSDKNMKSNIFLYVFIIYPFIFRIEHCCNPMIHFDGNFIYKNFLYLISNLFLFN